MSDNESKPQPLSGGNSNVVQRLGNKVLRPAGRWTPTIHSVLRALREKGIIEVPEPFGMDADGREVLSFIAGTVGNYPLPKWLWSTTILEEAAGLLRRMHDATAGITLEDASWQQPVHHPVEVICHNDFAPYNLMFDDGHVVGVIDFDGASPGPRIWDFAYMAYRLVPFCEDAGYALSVDDQFTRLEIAINAYGRDFSIDAVLNVMGTRLDDLGAYTDGRAKETGISELHEHAAMYRRDAERARAARGR